MNRYLCLSSPSAGRLDGRPGDRRTGRPGATVSEQSDGGRGCLFPVWNWFGSQLTLDNWLRVLPSTSGLSGGAQSAVFHPFLDFALHTYCFG
jgi:hypothetical protein